MFLKFGYSFKTWRLAVLVVLTALAGCSDLTSEEQEAVQEAQRREKLTLLGVDHRTLEPLKDANPCEGRPNCATTWKPDEVDATREVLAKETMIYRIEYDGKIETLPHPMNMHTLRKYIEERRLAEGKVVATPYTPKDATLMADGGFTYDPAARLAEIEQARAKGLDVHSSLKLGEVNDSYFEPTLETWTSPSGVQYTRLYDPQTRVTCWIRAGQTMDCLKL